jgi:hypothetical protein
MKVFVAAFVLTIGAFAQRIVTIPAGTAVNLAVGRAVSSLIDRPGDAVNFEVLDDVLIDGVAILARGAKVPGVVAAATPPGATKKGSVLQVKLQELRFPSGTTVRLGLAPPGAASVALVTTAGVLPTSMSTAGSATVSVHAASGEAFLVRGYQVRTYVQAAVVLDADKLLASPSPALSSRALSNEDVVSMFRAGRPEAEIVASIKSSPGDYRLAAEDIVQLKRAGLSSRIIEAMMAVAGKGARCQD